MDGCKLKTETLTIHLRNTIIRCTGLTFEYFASLEKDHWFELIGQPSENVDADYCQIEVQLLYRYFEGESEVIHLLAVADDGFHEFGADLFIYSDGRCRCDNGIYEILNGTPKKLGRTGMLLMPDDPPSDN